MPPVGSAAPEPDLPDEDLFLDGAEHDQDQPDCGKLREDPERDPDAAGHFRGAEEYRETGTRPDALRALDGILEVIPSAIDEHNGDHEAQEDRKSTRLNSSHLVISYAVFCLKKKKLSDSTPCIRKDRIFSQMYILLCYCLSTPHIGDTGRVHVSHASIRTFSGSRRRHRT